MSSENLVLLSYILGVLVVFLGACIRTLSVCNVLESKLRSARWNTCIPEKRHAKQNCSTHIISSADFGMI